MDAPMIKIHKRFRMRCEPAGIAFLAVQTDRPRWALVSGEADGAHRVSTRRWGRARRTRRRRVPV